MLNADTGTRLTSLWNGTAPNRGSPLAEPLCCGTGFTSKHVNLRRALSICDWVQCAGLRTRLLILVSSALTWPPSYGG
jgi:hypothetical protein